MNATNNSETFFDLSRAERSDERKRVASVANLTKNRCTLPGVEKLPKNVVIYATIFCNR